MKPLIVLAAAETDLSSAAFWYDHVAPGLGDAFLWRYEEAIQRLGTFPEMYQIYFDDVRRVSLRRFPHGVFYRVLSHDIEIVGVRHDHSDIASLIERLQPPSIQ